MPTFFITCTTRGTWLHGDQRGSFNKEGNFLPPNEPLRQSVLHTLKNPPFYLSDAMREIVQNAFQEVAQKKQWIIHRATVQHNHFHIAVTANDDPQKVLLAFKSKATMRLRKAEEITQDFSPWTAKGNVLTLRSDSQLTKACQYIEEHNNRQARNEASDSERN